MANWKDDSMVARYWKKRGDGRSECELCPRRCMTRDGQFGFCGVRGQKNGEMHTYIYGKSVAATEEVIETEAVNHYWPGARILSLGNVGCMMACDYCQNWQTSQVKHLDARQVRHYSSEQIVEMALENGIHMLSWTYNDPVVWQEFVVDTARLARKHGIRNLYKSAFYIEEKPVEELIEVMDIFSLSLKSMSEKFYARYTKGTLQPVLDRIVQVHKSGRHLELSQLLVTGLNETKDDVQKTIDWLLANLGDSIPLHFVAFHPAYKYLNVERTPLSALIQAKELADAAGLKYVYLGNVHNRELSSTYCKKCNNTLVERNGLVSSVVGLNQDGKCTKCGTQSPIVVQPKENFAHQPVQDQWTPVMTKEYMWDNEVKSLHLQMPADSTGFARVRVEHIGSGKVQSYRIGQKGLSRVIVSKVLPEDKGVRIMVDKETPLLYLPVLDRAHFPTSENVEEAR